MYVSLEDINVNEVTTEENPLGDGEASEHEVLFSCDQCDYKNTKASLLEKHKKHNHKVDRFPCNQCGYASSRLFNLKKHQLNKHSVEKGSELGEDASSLICDPTPLSRPPLLPKRRGRKTKRDSQIQEKNKRRKMRQARHKEDKGTASDSEEDKENTSDDYFSFRRESHSKTLSCDQCDFTSGIVAIMNRHKKSQHGELIVYPCDQCEFTANRPYRLKLHKKSEHSKVTSTKNNLPETSTQIQVKRSHMFIYKV